VPAAGGVDVAPASSNDRALLTRFRGVNPADTAADVGLVTGTGSDDDIAVAMPNFNSVNESSLGMLVSNIVNWKPSQKNTCIIDTRHSFQPRVTIYSLKKKRQHY